MYAIIGLGNPGKAYAGTRHNLGFQLVEALSGRLAAGRPFHCEWSLCATAACEGREMILAQPLTYMNRSGRAVAELVRRYTLRQENIVIVHDDLDLPPGAIRLRRGGGSAGHRGVQSVIDTLGTADFVRLRIGIGKPADHTAGSDFVLEPAAPEEQGLLDTAVARGVEAILLLVREGLDAAMNKYNQAWKQVDDSCVT
jgi:peptidyl-tRNA hydrolase, PTH1 family